MSPRSSNGTIDEPLRNIFYHIGVVLLGCSLGTLLAVIYLTCLWFGGFPPTVWKRIVIANWAATSITICALVIRLTTGAQMTLVTSILAWKMVKTGVLLEEIPRTSALRFSNSGPFDIFLAATSWRRSHKSPYLTGVGIVACLLTIMLQFTSTFLLSDLASAAIQSFPERSTYRVLGNGSTVDSDADRDLYIDEYQTNPNFPIFAETEGIIEAVYDHNVHDTGSNIRGLLPVPASSNRSRLMSFEGSATFYDARWVCTKPLLSNINLGGWRNFSGLSLYLAGQVSHTEYPALMLRSTQPGVFNCTITETHRPTAWTLLTCPVQQIAGILTSLEQYSSEEAEYIYNHTDGLVHSSSSGSPVLPMFGETVMIINITSLDFSETLGDLSSSNLTLLYETSFTINFNDDASWASLSDSAGPWIRLTSYQNNSIIVHNGTLSVAWTKLSWSFRLDASICSSSYSYGKEIYAEASRQTLTQEPALLDDRIVQVCATIPQRDASQRGILVLNSTLLKLQLHQEVASRKRITISYLLDTVQHSLQGTKLWYSAGGATPQTGLIHVHKGYVDLMQNIIHETGSPALALQAVAHAYIANKYYALLPYFRENATQTLTYSIDAVQPVRIRGFATVMTAIACHLLLVTYVLLVFGGGGGIRKALLSIDQAWPVFAQVSKLSEDLASSQNLNGEDGIGKLRSTIATDKEVGRELRQRGLRKKVFVLVGNQEGGIIQFQEKLSGSWPS